MRCARFLGFGSSPCVTIGALDLVALFLGGVCELLLLAGRLFFETNACSSSRRMGALRMRVDICGCQVYPEAGLTD